MSILTDVARDGKLITKDEYDLAIGELAEQYLAEYLTSLGLPDLSRLSALCQGC